MRRSTLFGWGLALTCAAASMAQAQVVNGGFETGDFTGWHQFGTITGFTGVTQDPQFNPAHSGDHQASFGIALPNGIYQFLATTPGATYDFQFWLSNLPANVINPASTPSFFSASWGGSPVETFIGAATFGYAQFGGTVLASDTFTELRFEFQNPQGYWDLDDVSVELVEGPTAVAPEPASVVLMASGLLSVAWLTAARRRRRPACVFVVR